MLRYFEVPDSFTSTACLSVALSYSKKILCTLIIDTSRTLAFLLLIKTALVPPLYVSSMPLDLFVLFTAISYTMVRLWFCCAKILAGRHCPAKNNKSKGNFLCIQVFAVVSFYYRIKNDAVKPPCFNSCNQSNQKNLCLSVIHQKIRQVNYVCRVFLYFFIKIFFVFLAPFLKLPFCFFCFPACLAILFGKVQVLQHGSHPV